MAKNKNTKKNVKVAKKVAKKLAPTAAQRKKIYRRSGLHKALPYLSMLFALILAICFIIVRVAEIEDGAGVVGNYLGRILRHRCKGLHTLTVRVSRSRHPSDSKGSRIPS